MKTILYGVVATVFYLLINVGLQSSKLEPIQECITIYDTIHVAHIDTVQVTNSFNGISRVTPHTGLGRHVTLEMLEEANAPFPKLAYASMIAESGWPGSKSRIANLANNNMGMTVSTTRCNAATIEDSVALYEHLRLVYNVDYEIATYNGKPILNPKGQKLVCLISKTNKYAIFLTPEACAKDMAEYQRANIRKQDGISPQAYLQRLHSLRYFDDMKAYAPYWLGIYNQIH